MLVQQAVSVGIIVWGVFLVSEGAITIGGLIAANILAGRVLAPLGTIAQTIFRAQYAFKSLGALNRFMALPVEHGPAIQSTSPVMQGAVALEEVTLTYPGAPRPALNRLNLSVAPGECVALLGRVGSGKTTAGKVIAGLLAPDSGTVLIDGKAQSHYDPADVRRGIGYLPQNPDLFTGTLRENVTLGTYQASDDEIMEALHLAGIDSFVAGLPEGLDYYAGEKGERLSGGQRQAISLARLLIRRPKFLFLDEPTNAMDHEAEARTIDRLRTVQASGVGMILSTHRLSLAAIAERYVVIESGRIVMDGPRDAVIRQLNAGPDSRARDGG